MRILDIARDMLDRYSRARTYLDAGQPLTAQIHFDDAEIAAAEIRARLAALVSA